MPQTVTVTATSVQDTTKSGIASVVVNSPPPTTKLTDLGPGSMPVIAVDSKGNLDVAWINSGILFSQSNDSGITFSMPLTVGMPNAAGNPLFVQIALDAADDINLICALNAVEPNLATDVFFSRSTDGGKTFSKPLQIPPQSMMPQLVVQPSGGISVVWGDLVTPGVFVMQSADGVTFTAPKMVYAVPSGDDVIDVAAVPGPQNQVYAFWTDEQTTNCQILAASSLDGGTTFSSATTISNLNPGCSVNPLPLVDSAGNVNVAWHDSSNDVVFSRSTNQGQTFSTSANVETGEFGVSSQQFVVEAGGAIDMVWQAEQTDFAVLFARSTDGGQTFSTAQTLSLPQKPSFTGGGDAFVAIDSCSGLNIVWNDDSNGTFSGDFDLYAVRSKNGGMTFTSPTNLTNTPNSVEVTEGQVADSSGNLYTMWETTSNSNLPKNGAPFDVFLLKNQPCGQ